MTWRVLIVCILLYCTVVSILYHTQQERSTRLKRSRSSANLDAETDVDVNNQAKVQKTTDGDVSNSKPKVNSDITTPSTWMDKMGVASGVLSLLAIPALFIPNGGNDSSSGSGSILEESNMMTIASSASTLLTSSIVSSILVLIVFMLASTT